MKETHVQPQHIFAYRSPAGPPTPKTAHVSTSENISQIKSEKLGFASPESPRNIGTMRFFTWSSGDRFYGVQFCPSCCLPMGFDDGLVSQTTIMASALAPIRLGLVQDDLAHKRTKQAQHFYGLKLTLAMYAQALELVQRIVNAVGLDVTNEATTTARQLRL